ncbi:hypothetical protein [Pseudarthrobacter siccitolerans]|nr:hypothetical protein [Pseudarthrobacter siccitolerans]
MAIGLKMDLEFAHPEDPDEVATFADLKRFVKRAEESGLADDHPILPETNERGDITGFSVYLPVDF